MNKTDEFKRRLKQYALEIIHFYNRLPERRNDVRVIGNQMLRSGTSIAANHREACRARSRAEFISKIEVCVQEADETLLWLELLRDGCGVGETDNLLKETDELISILVATARSAKR